jgi:hypothetical protein
MSSLSSHSRRALAAAALGAVAPRAAARKRKKKPKAPEPLAYAAITVRGVAFDPARGTFNWVFDTQARHPASGETISQNGTTLFGAVEATQKEAEQVLIRATQINVSAELGRRGQTVPLDRIAVVVL